MPAYNQPGRGRATGVFNAPEENVAPHTYDRPEDMDPDDPLVSELEKTFPGFRNRLLRQRAQAAQAQPQPAGPKSVMDNSDLFDPAAPHMQRVRLDNLKQGERYPQPDTQGAGATDTRSGVTPSPANVAPGSTAIGKRGVITDADMNIGAAGSAINPANDRRYMGRAEFKRFKGYGR